MHYETRDSETAAILLSQNQRSIKKDCNGRDKKLFLTDFGDNLDSITTSFSHYTFSICLACKLQEQRDLSDTLCPSCGGTMHLFND